LFAQKPRKRRQNKHGINAANSSKNRLPRIAAAFLSGYRVVRQNNRGVGNDILGLEHDNGDFYLFKSFFHFRNPPEFLPNRTAKEPPASGHTGIVTHSRTPRQLFLNGKCGKSEEKTKKTGENVQETRAAPNYQRNRGNTFIRRPAVLY
jgi:hypothetical protein